MTLVHAPPCSTQATARPSSTERLARLLAADARASGEDQDLVDIRRSLARINTWHADGILEARECHALRRAYAACAITYGNVVARYTTGDCYRLATALSTRTGWPIEVAHGEEGIESADHAFVVSSSGRCLDITGYRSRASISEEFGCTRFSHVDAHFLPGRAWAYDPDETRRQALAHARLTAELVCLAKRIDTR